MKREIAQAPRAPRTSYPQFCVLDRWFPRLDCDDALDQFRSCISSYPTRGCIPRIDKHNDRFSDQVQQYYEVLRKKFLLIAQDMLDFHFGVIIEYRVAHFAFVARVAR